MNRLVLKWQEYEQDRASLSPRRPEERAAFLAGTKALADLLATYGDEPDLWREVREAD
jgi:hypothetical protein